MTSAPAGFVGLLKRRKIAVAASVVVGLLVAVNVINWFGSARVGMVVGPVMAAVLVAVGRRAGLSWEDLGLGRRSWRKGAAYAAVAVVLVGIVYVTAAVLPATRDAFLDARYHLKPGSALFMALLVIPLGTVLLEEIAFRGVLLGLVKRPWGVGWASGVSSIGFGLWHVLPSLGLSNANHAVAAVFGQGRAAQIAVVAAVVGFTALAGLVFCELRRRSGSVLATVGLHWATNGLGVLVATALWATH